MLSALILRTLCLAQTALVLGGRFVYSELLEVSNVLTFQKNIAKIVVLG